MLKVVKQPTVEVQLKYIKNVDASNILFISSFETKQKIYLSCYLPVNIEKRWYLAPVFQLPTSCSHAFSGNSDEAISAESLNQLTDKFCHKKQPSCNYVTNPFVFDDEFKRFAALKDLANLAMMLLDNKRMGTDTCKRLCTKYREIFDKNSIARLIKLGLIPAVK